MLPDFIIIGSMKGGTTSLFHYLDLHQDVSGSAKKETNFLLEENYSKGVEWYKTFFDKDKQYCFEASPNYTKRHIFPGVPERMFALMPKVKLVYVLRDPIDRILSHYVHNYANGRESLSFADAIIKPDNNYIQSSMYYFQLEAFLEYCPNEQLLIVESSELQENTQYVLDHILDFVGISHNYDKSIVEKKFHDSSTKRRRSTFEQKLRGYSENKTYKKIIAKVAAPLRRPFKRPIISDEDRDFLANALSDDVEKLRTYTGKSFSDWSL